MQNPVLQGVLRHIDFNATINNKRKVSDRQLEDLIAHFGTRILCSPTTTSSFPICWGRLMI